VTLRNVVLAVSLIVASVGCGTKPKEPSKPVAAETTAIRQQPAPSTPQPFVLPEHIARCIANELVVTTYLRGGPEHLTVSTDIVLSQDVTPTSDEYLGFGIGMPLLQWTYDGRTLTKEDAWRAYVAQVAFSDRDPVENITTYCIWERPGTTAPRAIDLCVQRIENSNAYQNKYALAHADAKSAALRIIDANRDTVDAVIASLRRPHIRSTIAVMSGVGDAPVDECGIRQWQFGWYRDLLREHPISYAPLRDAAPGNYPTAIDDGACPMPGPAHPRTFEQLDTLSKETRRDMDDVYGPSLTRFIHLNGSPRLTHFLNVQFDPNDFRAIPQIDAVVSRRLRAAQTAQ